MDLIKAKQTIKKIGWGITTAETGSDKIKTDHRENKKHSENADTFTSVTFDLDVWPWLYVKVKKADVIRYRLLYCTLVPGIMSMRVMICEIKPFVHFCDLWNSSLTFIVCQGHFHFNHQMDITLLYIGTKYEVCMFNRIQYGNFVDKT